MTTPVAVFVVDAFQMAVLVLLVRHYSSSSFRLMFFRHGLFYTHVQDPH